MRKSKKTDAERAVPVAPASSAPSGRSGYTWHDSISGWRDAAVGYAASASATTAPSDRPKTREQQMDLAAKRDFDHLDQVNARAKAAARKIMTEPGPAHEAQPSTGTEPWRGYIGIDGPIARAARRMRGGW